MLNVGVDQLIQPRVHRIIEFHRNFHKFFRIIIVLKSFLEFSKI